MIGEMCNLSLGFREAGIREGMQAGIQAGIEKINKLFFLLMEQGRNEDMARAVQDQEFQQRLLEEFGIQLN